MKFKSPGNVLANPWVAMILIAVTVLVIYSNVYNGPFVFDGKLQIEDKMKIRDLNNYRVHAGDVQVCRGKGRNVKEHFGRIAIMQQPLKMATT